MSALSVSYCDSGALRLQAGCCSSEAIYTTKRIYRMDISHAAVLAYISHVHLWCCVPHGTDEPHIGSLVI